jgi:hypothetical protein
MSDLQRRLIRFSPLIALVFFVILMGHRIEHLPAWARWGIVLYIALSIVVPAFFGRQSRAEPRSTYAAIIQRYARTVWAVMLFVYIFCFIAGLIATVMLRQAIPLRYAIIALGVNLLFILLFWRAMFWSKPTK